MTAKVTAVRDLIASNKAVLAAAVVANTPTTTDTDARWGIERTIDVIVDSLDRAYSISPSTPKAEVLDRPFPIFRFTPAFFDRLQLMIRRAEGAGDLKIAGWLQNLDGQFTAESRVADTIRAHHVARSAKGGKSTAKRLKQVRGKFDTYVQDRFVEYEQRQNANHARITIEDFRQSVIRPLITVLMTSGTKNDRAFAKRLMGTAGTDGDGVMSRKQLKRILRKTEKFAGRN